MNKDEQFFNKKVAYMELMDYNPKNNKFEVGEKIVIICFASWCGACRMTKPEFAKIADKLLKDHKIRAAAIQFDSNEEEEQQLAKIVGKDFLIEAFPTFLKVDKNGKVVDTVVGGGDSETLMSKLMF